MTVELHQILHLPRKLNVQLECNFIKYCACHEKWQLNCTKYCTCHANWMCNRSATSPNIAPTRKSVLFFDSTTFLWLCNVVRISEASQLSFLWYYLVLGWVECTITLYFPLAKHNQRAVHQTFAGRSWIISQRMRSLQSKTAVQGSGHLHQCDRIFVEFLSKMHFFGVREKNPRIWQI